MNDLREQLRGLWLPLVTPFCGGELDETSLRRLVRHYASLPVDGFILAATSGEGMSLSMSELERLVAIAMLHGQLGLQQLRDRALLAWRFGERRRQRGEGGIGFRQCVRGEQSFDMQQPGVAGTARILAPCE